MSNFLQKKNLFQDSRFTALIAAVLVMCLACSPLISAFAEVRTVDPASHEQVDAAKSVERSILSDSLDACTCDACELVCHVLPVTEIVLSFPQMKPFIEDRPLDEPAGISLPPEAPPII